jgi:2'-5' RNA ligase
MLLMRVFICIELSEEARREASKVIEEIESWGLIKGKYVNPDNLHLTLKFLGEISEKEVDMVKKALSSVQGEKQKVKLGKVGVFSPDYIKVLWLDLESEKLGELQKDVERALGNLSSRERREWSSHVTLARVKSVKDRKEFMARLEMIKVKDVEFIVDKIKLKKSILTPKGPIYEDLFVQELEKK